MREEVRPITYLKTKAAALLSQVNDSHRPVIITQKGEPRAVLQDPESYERMRAALAMLKLLAQGEAELRARKGVRQERVFAELRQGLRSAKRRAEA